ncbi:MAG: hypothetical protein H7210_03825 [Pyrinomonadaceae bacterium]|nr:hypothetical protein [Phycisphaerales bacterium]
MKKFASLSACVFLFTAPVFGDVVEFAIGGSDADVTTTVNAFRAATGGVNNPNVPGSFLSGRREINWDGVAETAAAPNLFPGNFFNAGVAPRARGAEFTSPGAGTMVSATAANSTNTPINFGNLDPSYVTAFRPFTPQRLFAPIGSTTTEVKFFIPGQSSTRATVTSFGAVFSDVDTSGPTLMQFFEQSGALLRTVVVPPTTGGPGGFSFAGVQCTAGEKIWRVVIVTGTQALGAGVLDNPGAGVDLVVMDDFIYSEPVTVTDPTVFASGGSDAEVTDTVNAFRAALGALNPNAPGSVGSGRREVNWDGVPDTASSPNAFPADFFNVNSPRGVVFSTPGSSLQVSADASNPTATPTLFSNIDPSYAGLFRVFSPQRLFTAIGSTAVTTNFFVPGGTIPASVSGFGSLLTDVDLRTSARIDYLDQRGNLLASIHALPGTGAEQSLSFLGAHFSPDYKLANVKVTSGTTALAAGVIENTAGGIDLVAMDDFIYGEPVELPPLCRADVNADGFVNSADFFDFLTGFFSGNFDFNNDGFTNSQDLYDFLVQFFVGC